LGVPGLPHPDLARLGHPSLKEGKKGHPTLGKKAGDR
jgi:hypothetical protein